MPRSSKLPPVGPEPLDLINQLRTFTSLEVREALERTRRLYPDMYVIIADFILNIKTKPTYVRPIQ